MYRKVVFETSIISGYNIHFLTHLEKISAFFTMFNEGQLVDIRTGLFDIHFFSVVCWGARKYITKVSIGFYIGKELRKVLAAQRNCRYPPVAFGDLYEVQGQLESQFEEISNIFKRFKLDTFDAVEEFLTISIY